MRGVLRDLVVEGVRVPAGKLVAISPAVSHRIPELFRDPTRFDPSRYDPGREEDARPFAWIPFGGGHHRCSGAAFAIMQLKAITMSLLRRFTFELVDPPDSYGPDYTKMVVQVRQPCRVRYRRRADVGRAGEARTRTDGPKAAAGSTRVRVDLGLCQGHAVCVSEAPELFRLNAQETAVDVLRADVPAALRAKLDAAVKHCPTHALAIEDL
jgi:sterol 14-demethylase